MSWKMDADPLDNVFLSALIAAIPILAMFWALAVRRMKGHHAALIAAGSAFAVAVIGFGMPAGLALLALVDGMLFGLFPIAWIVVTAVFLFNITVKAGQFEVIKNSIAAITDDRRLQALLIAFSFGSFLEGAAGFGAPVAISAAMLAGLGFTPLYAAGICLLANTAPVAFGAIGIPIIVAGQVTNVDFMAISRLVGLNLLFLSAIIPFYLVGLMAGRRGVAEAWPAVLVSGVSFGVSQWVTAAYLGPFLPDIIASLVSIVLLTLFLRVWHPAVSWRFAEEPPSRGKTRLVYTGGQVFRAWAPFVILTIVVAAWGLPPVKQTLDALGLATFAIPGLHAAVISDGQPMPALFTFNYLSSPGTAIFLAGIATLLLLKAPVREGARIFGETAKTMRFSIVTIAVVLGFAYLSNFSGISIALAHAFAATGALFPFFSPFIGWLGVFITGSDTSANALFGKLQEVTALQTGINPVIAVAANSTGGVTAKMISPQSIAIATAAVGLAGREADLFRFTLKHSLLLTLLIGVMTLMEAYAVPWAAPEYRRVAAAEEAARTPMMTIEGVLSLAVSLALVLLVFLAASRLATQRRARQ